MDHRNKEMSGVQKRKLKIEKEKENKIKFDQFIFKSEKKLKMIVRLRITK